MSHPAENTHLDTIGMIVPVAALCIALNVGLGTVINIVKAPIYLDAVGTIAFALLARGLGWRGFAWASVVGAISFGLGALLFNPVLVWFIPTQVAIAAYSCFFAGPVLGRALTVEKLEARHYLAVVLLGLLLGVVAGTVSAPVIAYLFGGITGAGASLITAVLLKSGETLFNSVLLSGLASEPIDKLLQLALAVSIVRWTPSRVRSSMQTK